MTPEELDKLLAAAEGLTDGPGHPDLQADLPELEDDLRAQALLALEPPDPGLEARVRAELAVVPAPSPAPAARARRWWSGWWLAAAPVTAALGLALRVATLPPLPALPTYSVQVLADATQRSGSQDDAPLRLSAGSALQITLLADAAPEGEVEARAWIRADGGWQELELEDSGAVGGSFRLTGEVTQVPDGTHPLLIGVGVHGPRGTLERALGLGGPASFTDAELDAALAGARVSGWAFESRDLTLYGGDE